ncbi:MAG: hypothetical protein ACJ75B_20840 [Flavisolibacter sp.]
MDNRVFLFCLDDLVSVDDDGNAAGDIRVELRNGRVEHLPYDIDHFCAKIYSDENEGEYFLVEIEEQETPPEGPFFPPRPFFPAPNPNG